VVALLPARGIEDAEVKDMRTLIMIAILWLGIAGAAVAAEHAIDQKDLSFSKAEITIAAGDKIKFTNNDRTAHHLWTKDNGLNISSPTLKSGDSFVATFSKAGTYTIKCHIHPKMKLIVIVK
jgi:plastocyanin